MKKITKALAADLADSGESSAWYSLTTKDGTNTLTLVTDIDSELTADVPVDLDQVTAFTRMAVVDAEWVERTRVNTEKVIDAENRLTQVGDLHAHLDNLLGRHEPIDPARFATILTDVRDQLATIVEPRKGGVI